MIDNIRTIGLFKRTSASIVSILLSSKFEMANRYCLNGNNRFLSVEGTGRSLRVLIFEEGADKKIAKFTPQRWAQFVLILDEIAENVKSLSIMDSKVTFRNHIGGKWYVSVTVGFKCVDIREFYWHREEKRPAPSKRGIALRLPEWTCLTELISHLHLQHPELAAAEPCWAGQDHYNQV
jgi:hypothetical protein